MQSRRHNETVRSDELDYDLPEDRIATDPAEPRDSARLMIARRHSDIVEHHTVADLPLLDGLINADDLLVLNRTQVLPARFSGHRAATGGHVEGLYLRSPEPGCWRVMLESRGHLNAGEVIRLGGVPNVDLELVQDCGDGQWQARLQCSLEALEILRRIGQPPLPPYIRRRRRSLGRPQTTREDADRYNTVFGCEPGSVAAPTAALHFTARLLDQIEAKGVKRATLTLHIGLGTFSPVRTERLDDHTMHAERMTIPATTIEALNQARHRGSRIIPVGTTCVRALESLPDSVLRGPRDFCDTTNLFIRPGSDPYAFRFADALMTNFHLPRSTLMALVAALPGVGLERLKRWYRIAIDEGYRFYSYGDAMLVL